MRRPSDSSLSTVAPVPAISEADVLRASVKAASGAARVLHAFGDSAGASSPAIKGFRAFATALSQSLRDWEAAEVQRFLECVCFTPQPKKGRAAVPAPNDGDFVLDCYVAERFYERSGFGRATYRMLRQMAEEKGLVITERRQSQPAAPGGRKGAARAKNGPTLKQPKQNGPSTTSVPLLIKLTKKGWDFVGARAKGVLGHGQLASDALYHVLRGQDMPSPVSLASASSLSSVGRSSDGDLESRMRHVDSNDHISRPSQEFRNGEDNGLDSLTGRTSSESLFSENSFFALAMGEGGLPAKLGTHESLESLSVGMLQLPPLPVTSSPEISTSSLSEAALFSPLGPAVVDGKVGAGLRDDVPPLDKSSSASYADLKSRSWLDVATQEGQTPAGRPLDYRAEVFKTVDRAGNFVQTDGPTYHVGGTGFHELGDHWDVPAVRGP